MKADLHVHTTASDGTLSPWEVVSLAVAQGISTLAITDHDTLDGVDHLQGQPLPITLIQGVELSLRDMPGLHLLGYGVGKDAISLREKVCELARHRIQRGQAMLEKLQKLGIDLPKEELLAREGTIGRAHIARMMVQCGAVTSVQQAFERYLAEGAPAYVPGKRLSMAEALECMRVSGVVPVLAHPALLAVGETLREPLLRSWKEQGLQGVEVFHPSQNREGFALLERSVRRIGFLVTGGSDFHTPEGDSHAMLGAMSDAWKTAAEDTKLLVERIQQEHDRVKDKYSI